MKRDGKEVVFVEVDPKIKAGLNRAAKLVGGDTSMSDLARESFTDKLKRLSKKHPELETYLPAA